MPKTKKPRDETRYRLLPPLDAETYAGLKANIAVNGVQVPIVRDEHGHILDGFAREQIARELGYECPSVVAKGLTEQEKRSAVRALNLARRHLDHPARTQIIADELRENPERSNRWIAKSLGVDDKAVARVRAGMQATAVLPQLGFTLGSDGKFRPATKGKVATNGDERIDSGNSCAEELRLLDPQDEEAVLRLATEIRRRRVAERVRLEAERQEAARLRFKGKRTWTLTDDPKVVRCSLLIVDPPFGITDEPWEPEDVEGFNRDWCEKWSGCGADFIAIFWCQERLWEGRTWFDQSLKGYEFQQVLTWQANNHCGPKSRLTMKQSWYPIFLYRKRHTSRRIVRDDKTWDTERHNLDCHVAPLPQTTYRGAELKQHPCQKPVSVMRWLINALSEPGELVWSLFCGVAPCGVAAVQLGRRYRGIEQSAEYRRIAEGRIAAYKDKPQEDDQEDEDAILRAAAEIRQRRVAARLKEIQEKRQQSRPARIRRGSPVLHGDCLDLIPSLEDGSVSLVVTSPPYAEQRAGHYGGIPEEDYPDFTVNWMSALAPKMTKDGSVLIIIRPHLQDGVLSDYVLRTRLALREAGWHECEELIWLKVDAPPLGSLKRPRRTWESILWFSRSTNPYVDLKACGRESDRVGFDGSLRFGVGNGKPLNGGQAAGCTNGVARISDVIVANVGGNEPGLDHPAMFPLALAEQLVKTFSQPGDLVLDPFCGTGQTLLAAKGCGRRYLGIEREVKYVKITLGRLG
jgi:site-specific DNA-methyltransferase (adenine-specific)/site-specific DNA-methyltransferase (cytosine-N4-specific)